MAKPPRTSRVNYVADIKRDYRLQLLSLRSDDKSVALLSYELDT